MPHPFDPALLLHSAQQKEGLADGGPVPFEAALAVLTEDYAAADLNDVGVHILRSGLVHSLRMRLRAQEWIRRHPEILEETIVAPIVVVGMMRSGTTLLQRLLAADNRFHCAYGWEVVEVAPKLDYRWSDHPAGASLAKATEDPRIVVSEKREAATRELAPNCSPSTPCTPANPKRRSCSSPTPSCRTYRSPARTCRATGPGSTVRTSPPRTRICTGCCSSCSGRSAEAGRDSSSHAERWVLKSPAHLGYLDALRAQFPDLHVVHMHRDPRETIPSGASLNATLHAMHADRVDRHRVGVEWLHRMGWTNDRAMATRDRWADESAVCTDVEFTDAVADPIGQVSRVYDAIGVPLSVEAETAMRRWLVERPREAARPAYAANDFGLTDAQIDERFTSYDARFRTGARSRGGNHA